MTRSRSCLWIIGCGLLLTRFLLLIRILSKLQHGAMRSDVTEVVVDFPAVHHADGDGVNGRDVEDVVDGVARGQVAAAHHFHAVNPDVVGVHFFQNGNDPFGRAVHVFACVVDARQNDVDPRGKGGLLKRVDIVARNPVGADDAALLFLGEHVHDPAIREGPLLVGQAMHENDVDVIGIQFAQDAIHIALGLAGRGGANFGGDDHVLAVDVIKRGREVAMATVLIRAVPKRDAPLKAVDEQVGQCVRSQVRLVGTPAPTIGARAKTELRDRDAGGAEFDDFHGELLVSWCFVYIKALCCIRQ